MMINPKSKSHYLLLLALCLLPVSAASSEINSPPSCDFKKNDVFFSLRKELSYFKNNFIISRDILSEDMLKVSLSTAENDNSLILFGSKHVSKPDSELFERLESLVLEEKPNVIYLEVSDINYLTALPLDKQTVIQTRGEPSYLAYIAREHSIPVQPLEPDSNYIFRYLENYFSVDEIGLSFVLRDIQILRDRRNLFGEELESIAVQSIEKQRSTAHEAGKNFSITNILELTLAVEKLWPGLDWRRIPAQWANPTLESRDTGSKFTNSVFARAMAARDEYATKLLYTKILSGNRVFVLLGRTHVETHYKNLQCASILKL
jgi:hypothetical protein